MAMKKKKVKAKPRNRVRRRVTKPQQPAITAGSVRLDPTTTPGVAENPFGGKVEGGE